MEVKKTAEYTTSRNPEFEVKNEIIVQKIH